MSISIFLSSHDNLDLHKIMDRASILAEATSDTAASPIKWTAIFSLKIAIWASWITLSVYGLYRADGIASTLALQALLGAAFAHGVELQHQALHQSGFRSRGVNRFFGVLLGLPMLVCYSSYQDSHLFHHNKLGTDEDSEFFEYGDKSERRMVAIIKNFFLINHFCEFLKHTIDALNWRVFKTKLIDRNSAKIRTEYLVMAGSFFGCCILASRVDSNLFIKCWAVPLFIFAAPIHALIELPEHFDCARNTSNVFENTRTVITHPLMTWFTNGNNYHVEHHWIASLPIEKLATVHRQISGRIVNLSPSYRSFYLGFFSSLLFGSSSPPPGEPTDGS
ncbi:fatty acid desaturase [Paraburkholderia strydomiana]|uniref:Fatty acid desaturase n=1 Tax=Paraburkholderia strydomiana TaxID=1245417 RepID=A0ABW9ERR8_9BURK